jgi:hypothetical protein
MQERFVITDIPLNIPLPELLRAARIEDDPLDDDYCTVKAMLAGALACARPKFVYGLAAVTAKGDNFVIIEGCKIVSPLVRANLDKTQRIVPYVATCGVEVDRWSQQFTDVLEQYWADLIKNKILHQAAAIMRTTVKARYFPAADFSQMNPGSLPAWPLTQQTVLFDLIGHVERDTGVALTESCLMLPSKSVSGFFFSSAIHFENCALCPMPHCPGRRVPMSDKNRQRQTGPDQGM